MKPITLKIKGINSFIEEQVIDFGKLSDRGIFGIFGPTGSGKSTILDALTLALYNEIARNSKEFINKDVVLGHVYFEFEINTTGSSHIYAVERTYKKIDTDASRTMSARLYDKTDEENIKIIADKNNTVNAAIIEIIGLKYKDFTCSVVLPQGKFSDFLTLSGKDRRDMLERIFHLEKYGSGITDKINTATTNERAKLNEVVAKLSVYGNINEAIIENEKINLKKLVNESNDILIELEQKNKELGEAEALKELNKELEGFKNKELNLKSETDEINNIISKLLRAKRAVDVMPYLISLNEINEKLVVIKEEMLNIEETCAKAISIYEKSKVNYDEALKEKSEKYPVYLKREENLKQAVIIVDEVKVIEEERQTLADEYKYHKNKFKIETDNFNKLCEEKNNNKLKYDELLKRKLQITIDTEYKEKIRIAFDIEKSYRETNNTVNELNNKLYNYTENIKLKTIECEETKQELDRLKIINTNLKFELEAHNNKSMSSNEDLVKLTNSVNESKTNLSEITKLVNRQNIIISEKENKLKITHEYEDSLLKSENQINELKVNIESLENQIDAIEKSNMASILSRLLEESKPCPVCGSTNHPLPAENIISELSQSLINDKSKYKTQKDMIEESYKKTNLKLEKIRTEYEVLVNEGIEIEKSMNGMTIEEVKRKLCKSENEYKNYIAELKEHQIYKKEHENNLSENEKLINVCSQRKSAIDEALKITENHKNEIEIESKAVSDKFNKLCIKLNELIEELKPEKSFTDEMAKINKKEKEKESIEKDEERIKKAIDETEALRDTSNNLINDIQNKMSVVEMQGKEKRKIIDDKRLKINELSDGNENPKEYLIFVTSEIERIINQEQYTKITIEEAKTANSESQNKKIKINEQFYNFKDQLKSYEIKLEELKLKNGFVSDNDVKEAFLNEEEQIKYQLNIDNYNTMMSDTMSNIKRLEAKTQCKTISNERLEEIRVEAKITADKKEEAIRLVAVKSSEIKSMIEKLEAVKILKSEESKINHKYSLLMDLSELMKGNKFVEYIATGQLEYITTEASKRLKKITKGRYALELNGSEFIMRDDFNGGSRRKPDTLSGGEVFLTSFALALALSSKIQMNNNAPLQFFFLDEGFGTLDNSLLDIVMTSLESLHSEELSVGIITHVEELKERIPVKLMVTPAVQGVCGTKTNLEYV